MDNVGVHRHCVYNNTNIRFVVIACSDCRKLLEYLVRETHSSLMAVQWTLLRLLQPWSMVSYMYIVVAHSSLLLLHVIHSDVPS